MAFNIINVKIAAPILRIPMYLLPIGMVAQKVGDTKTLVHQKTKAAPARAIIVPNIEILLGQCRVDGKHADRDS
jgi:hypothetical protein